MKTKALLWLSFCLWLCACNQPQITDTLPRSIPEKEGVSSQGILNFIEAVEQSGQEWHSFMLLRHGKVIAEGWWDPFRSDLRHMMYSTSKTFTSTAIGFAVSEGRLSVDDKVISFFPEQLPDTVSPNLEALRVKDLLCMAVGHDPEPFDIIGETNWVKAFLSTPVVNEPGTKFLYNSLATYMLSAIIQKVTGEKLIDYLTPRLFEPLAIEGADWEDDPEGINTGGWGLRIKTEDMAKLGQLYLQKGQWNGKQLIPVQWIEEATSAKIMQKPGISQEQKEKDDWAQGYCYQIWRCRNNAFRADGAFGQYIIVMPEQDAVLAVTANVNNMQEEINLVWDYLLPAIQQAPVLSDKKAEAALRQKLSSLAIQPSVGVISTMETELANETSYSLDTGHVKAFSFRFENDVCHAIIRGSKDDFPLVFGRETWIAGETRKPGSNLVPSNITGFSTIFKVRGSYCWKDEQTLILTLRYIEGPHYETVTCRFEDDLVHIETTSDINRKLTMMTGKLMIDD